MDEKYCINMLGFFPQGIPQNVLKMAEDGTARIVDSEYAYAPLVWFENVQQIDSEKFLHFCYDIIGCDLIDHFYCTIGGKDYCLIVDDEGLFKEDNCPSVFRVVDDQYKPVLVGNFFVCADGYIGDGYNCSFPFENLDSFCQEIFPFPYKPYHCEVRMDD